MAQIIDKNILDRKFLEFWGNLFLNVAKGQEQIEQLSSMMNMDSINNMDFMNFNNMAKMFRQSYGLPLDESDRHQQQGSDKKSHKPDETETVKLRESFEAFQSSFSKYITIWGWVPKAEHEELKKSYDTLKHDYDILKEKADTQQELISQLRDTLNAKGIGHVELFHNIQNLTRKQAGEFQNLIQNLFKTDDNKTGGVHG